MKAYMDRCDQGYVTSDLPDGRAMVLAEMPVDRGRWPKVDGRVELVDVTPTNRRVSAARTGSVVSLLARWVAHQRNVKVDAVAAHGAIRALLGTWLRHEEAQCSLALDPHPLLGQRVYLRGALDAIDANVISGTRGAVVHAGIAVAACNWPDGAVLTIANQSRPRTAGTKGGVLLEDVPAWLVHRCDAGCFYCPTLDEKAARAMWHRLHLAFAEDVGVAARPTPRHCRWIHAADALTLAMTGELPC